MKKLSEILLIIMLMSCFCGCGVSTEPAQVAATTLPVYEFTSRLCDGTDITVTRLVTEEVSCLHDYSLNVRQVKAAEAAEVIVVSGAGLEEFLDDILLNADTIDASAGIKLLCLEEAHEYEEDPHIWLDPSNAAVMARNICLGLTEKYPEYADIFAANLDALTEELDDLYTYGENTLSSLSCRELITFHDGFAYFADAFDLTILEAVEEESGSEASAQELKHLIEEVEHHSLPAIFTEKSGSASAADVISQETGADIFSLDMAMSGGSYFDAMYHNIDTIKEALG